VVIARRVASINVRWAHNTVTTNGDADEVQLSVISVIGRRVASVCTGAFLLAAAGVLTIVPGALTEAEIDAIS